MSVIIPAHTITRHLIETINDPSHVKRQDTPEFRAAKKRLKQDGHYHCYICGTTQHLEAHHYGMEKMLESVTDFEALQAFLLEWDVYGYSHLLRNKPLTSLDDLRNILILCREHHCSSDRDGAANGVHNISFPAWISQKLVKRGEETIPQDATPLDGE